MKKSFTAIEKAIFALFIVLVACLIFIGYTFSTIPKDAKGLGLRGIVEFVWCGSGNNCLDK